MPLCPQVTITPVTVTSTGMTTSNIDGVYDLNTSSPAFTSVQSTANNAWSAVVGKNTVYYAASAPTGGSYTVGDTWFNTAAGYQMSQWNGSAWVAVQFGNAAFAGGSVDLSKLASGSVDASKLVTGAVTYGKIAAGAVGATEIAANSIVAGNIAANTITSSQIAAGTITASNIAAGSITTDRLVAGTLTGFTINNGSGTFTVSSGGAMTATSGTIGGFNIGATQLYTTGSALQLFSNSGGSGGYNIIAFNGIQGGSLDANGGAITGGSLNITGNSTLGGGVYTSTGFYNAGLSGRSVVVGGSPYQLGSNSSSSRRYKQDIAPAAFDPSPLLSLPMQQFRYIKEVAAQGAKAQVQTGLMAEDVAAAGLEWLIDRDDQGRPDYIFWSERMPQALLGLVQQLAARIAKLEGKP